MVVACNCFVAGRVSGRGCCFVHHHLSGFSVDVEHNAPQYAPDFLSAPVSLDNMHACSLFTLTMDGSNRAAASVIQCFCGWHSSAYLEVAASFA